MMDIFEDLKFMWDQADIYNRLLLILIPLIIITGVFSLGLYIGMGVDENPNELQTMKSQIETLNENMVVLNKKVSKLERENMELARENIELQKRNDELNDRIEELNNKLSNKNEVDNSNENTGNAGIDYNEYDYALNPNDYDDSVYYGSSLNKKDIDTIYKYSLEDGRMVVDPHLVIAILFRESSFRDYVSNGDCYGLGQVRLSTAKYIEEKFDYNDNIDKDKLYNRTTNIKYVVSYLKYLYRRYDGDKEVLKRYSGSSSDKVLKGYLGGMNRFLLDTRGHDIYDILDFNL
jgi:soluble lytic murein transglycosylase-like protein